MKLFLTYLFFLLVFQVASAQATATFTASATIIQPIAVATVSNLNFAGIDAKNGGEIILTPQGERSAVGDISMADESAVTAAAFEVSGEQGFSFSVNLPKGEYNLVNGNESMLIKNFTSSLQHTANLNGNKTLVKVGATLKVNSRQRPGNYVSESPLSITVNYN